MSFKRRKEKKEEERWYWIYKKLEAMRNETERATNNEKIKQKKQIGIGTAIWRVEMSTELLTDIAVDGVEGGEVQTEEGTDPDEL